MARESTPGKMKTRIRVLKPRDFPDAKRYRNPEYVNIYDDDRVIRCQWVSAFGTEAIQAYSLGVTDLATLTLRYDPRITGDCIIEKLPPGKEDPNTNPALRYKIITVPNDVGDSHKWLEFKVSRREAAL